MGMLTSDGDLDDEKAKQPRREIVSPKPRSVPSYLQKTSTRALLPLRPPPSNTRTQLPSMFGKQILSQRTSGPRLRFGTADRAAVEKQYFNQELNKCRSGMDGPGPIYNTKASSIGKQVASINQSAAEFAFGVSRRFSMLRYGGGNPGPGSYGTASTFGPQVLSYQKSPWITDFGRSTRDQQNKIYMSAEFDKNKYGVESPGPTVCDETSSVGTQVVAPFKSAPRTHFGNEKRFKYPFMSNNTISPGVGKYEILGSLGKQLESKKKNLPAFSFPNCNRDQRAKVFISHQHDKSHYGEASPGPGAQHKSFPSMGEPQIDSRKTSCNALRFSSAPRFKDYYSDNPGPGNYNC